MRVHIQRLKSASFAQIDKRYANEILVTALYSCVEITVSMFMSVPICLIVTQIMYASSVNRGNRKLKKP